MNKDNRDGRTTGRSRLLQVLFIFVSAPIIGAVLGSGVPDLLQQEADGGAMSLPSAVLGFVIGGIVGVGIIVRLARRDR